VSPAGRGRHRQFCKHPALLLKSLDIRWVAYYIHREGSAATW
jgi:hypothetical protein